MYYKIEPILILYSDVNSRKTTPIWDRSNWIYHKRKQIPIYGHLVTKDANCSLVERQHTKNYILLYYDLFIQLYLHNFRVDLAVSTTQLKLCDFLCNSYQFIYVSLRLRVQNRRRKTKSAAQFQTHAVKCDGVFFVLQHGFQYGFQHA